MDLSNISKSIFAKKNSDYIFIIFFLLVFSVFIVGAIKPSLTTAFSLKKEEADLKSVDKVYEEKIMNISAIQSQVEENRDSLPLLNQSISENPEVNKIIEDIKTTADKNLLTINKASIIDINLSKSHKDLQQVRLLMDVTADFDNLKKFMTELMDQRRLKVIDSLSISRDKDSTGSSSLKVSLTIDGFYL